MSKDPLSQMILNTLAPVTIGHLLLSDAENLDEKMVVAKNEILALTSEFAAPLIPENPDEETATILTTAFAGALLSLSLGLPTESTQAITEGIFLGEFARTGRNLPVEAATQMTDAALRDLLYLSVYDPEGVAETRQGILDAWNAMGK